MMPRIKCATENKNNPSRVYLCLLSFVHPIKGPPKMGVKRSNQRLRSSQSCQPTPTEVANLVTPHQSHHKKRLSEDSPISLYINFLTHLNSLYGIYLNGRSSHVGVTTTDLRCEKE